MTNCIKCNCRLVKQQWIVDGEVFCSPFCERSTWDAKTKKFTTKSHRFGDTAVKRFGVAGLKKDAR